MAKRGFGARRSRFVKPLHEVLEQAEAWLVGIKTSGRIPPDAPHALKITLSELPDDPAWRAWRDAISGLLGVIAREKGGAEELWTLLFNGLGESYEALGGSEEVRNAVIPTVTDRFALFLPDEEPVEESEPESEAPEPTAFARPQQAGEPIPEIDEELREAFIAEATELLQQIEECVLSLTGNPQSVERLFRVMHTLKGSSGMVGFQSMNRLAHAAEETLEKVRKGTLTPNVVLEEALLLAKDVFTAMVGRVEQRQNPELDVDVALATLRSAVTGKPSPQKAAVPPNAAIPGGGEGATTPGAVSPSPATTFAAKEPARKEAAATIRINQEKLDEVFERMGEVVIGRIRIETHLGRLGDMVRNRSRGVDTEEWRARLEDAYDALHSAIEEHSRAHGALQERVMALRLAPVGTVFDRFPRVVRETSRKVGKEIDFRIAGSEVEIDKGICESIIDPLIHLIRNAIDHGIEPPADRIDRGKPAVGRVNLSAAYRGDRVVIEISDDGRGMDAERIGSKAVEKGLVTADEVARMDERDKLMLIFRPGFSTAESVSDLSGRGVGMDVVRDVIERLKGTVEVESRLGQGSSIMLLLPLTLALVDLLVVRVGGEIVAFPLYVVRETLQVSPDQIERAGDRPVTLLRGAYLPVVALADVLGLRAGTSDILNLVIVEVMGEAVALEVDAALERCEVVLKPLGDLLSAAPFLSGATILGDGRIVPVLDPVPILREASQRRDSGAERPATTGKTRRRILVVEDSATMAQQLTTILTRAGFSVSVARDGLEGLEQVRREAFDIVSTDIVMPRMDGYEFCKKMREDARLETLPLVALTSKTDKLDRIRGFEAGIDEYLTKPVEEEVYLATLERLLNRSVRTPA
jgi:two-component system, chemotaxis family, sensor kinase CheA